VSHVARIVDRWGWLAPLIGCVVLLVLPALGLGPADRLQFGTIAIYTLLVSATNLTYGYAGELVFSQVTMFAVSAYVAAYAGIHWTTDLLVTVPLAVAASIVIAVATGVPSLRLGGWSLAMVSFFTVLLIPDVLNITEKWTGGFAGLPGIPSPSIAGADLDDTAVYLVIVATTFVWLFVLRNIVVSRHGLALQVMRTSPILARSLGISVPRLKLKAYVISGVPAGIAGALFAFQNSLVAPEYFTFGTSISVIAGSVLGGAASVCGAIFGATVVQIIPLKFLEFQKYAPIVFGAVLIFAGTLLPGGIASVARKLWRRILPVDGVAPSDEASFRKVEGRPVTVSNVSVAFGGNVALNDVSLSAQPGQITALIGPNGSGKTTLLNTISGLVRAKSGEIYVGDERTDGKPSHKVARFGVSRTFQTPIIPPGMPVADAVSIARYERPYSGMLHAILRTPGFRRLRKEDRRIAEDALVVAGTEDLAGRLGSELPLGTRRLVEVARGLASGPSVILLDEAASGLNKTEVAELGELLKRLRDTGATIILVEHNFRLVMSIADVIHVLNTGQLLASGSPDEIAGNREVIDVYLGRAPDAVPGDESSEVL
jgi:branched-chain amino acid transport system permease protein